WTRGHGAGPAPAAVEGGGDGASARRPPARAGRVDVERWGAAPVAGEARAGPVGAGPGARGGERGRPGRWAGEADRRNRRGAAAARGEGPRLERGGDHEGARRGSVTGRRRGHAVPPRPRPGAPRLESARAAARASADTDGLRRGEDAWIPVVA